MEGQLHLQFNRLGETGRFGFGILTSCMRVVIVSYRRIRLREEKTVTRLNVKFEKYLHPQTTNDVKEEGGLHFSFGDGPYWSNVHVRAESVSGSRNPEPRHVEKYYLPRSLPWGILVLDSICDQM